MLNQCWNELLTHKSKFGVRIPLCEMCLSNSITIIKCYKVEKCLSLNWNGRLLHTPTYSMFRFGMTPTNSTVSLTCFYCLLICLFGYLQFQTINASVMFNAMTTIHDDLISPLMSLIRFSALNSRIEFQSIQFYT